MAGGVWGSVCECVWVSGLGEWRVRVDVVISRCSVVGEWQSGWVSE